MISTVDKLLLTSSQQEELERLTRAYEASAAAGDTAGMETAHRRAEEIRATAGYSGGEAGDRYELLDAANGMAAFNGYKALVDHYVGEGINAINANYENRLAQLNKERAELEQQNVRDQAAARSAVWNTHRLAADGLLTRGLENTGIADALTASALNQAAANAYQSLLAGEQHLNENDVARADARADALSEAAELKSEVGALLGDAYKTFYKEGADRVQSIKEQAQDYYYKLALQELKRQWELEDRALGL